MCNLLNSLRICTGKLLIKVTSGKNLYSEYSDKNRKTSAPTGTPKLLMCILERTSKCTSLLGYGSAVGAVCVS